MSYSNFTKIEVLNDKNEAIISSAKINIEGNKIILHGNDFPIIDHNKRVNVISYNKDGIVHMEGITSLSIDTQINIEIIHSSENKDRRFHLKVKTNDMASITRAYALCGYNKSYKVEENVRIRDISVGGISFYSNKVFFKKQKVILNLNAIKGDLNVEAVVLRKNLRNAISGYKYQYSCRFIELRIDQERIICEYVFKVELENHYSKLEKDQNIYDD